MSDPGRSGLAAGPPGEIVDVEELVPRPALGRRQGSASDRRVPVA